MTQESSVKLALDDYARRVEAESAHLRTALVEIVRLRIATDEGSLRVRADRMWEVATAAIARTEAK